MPDEFDCLDCNVSTLENREYYMLNDDLWLDIHPEDDGMLCIGCVENRLGRVLTPDDFTDAPVNSGAWEVSARLADRLGL